MRGFFYFTWMDSNKGTIKNPRRAFVFCGIYLAIIFFWHHIDKYSGGTIFILLLLFFLISTIMFVVKAIKHLVHIIKYKTEVKIRTTLMLLYLLIAVGIPYLWWHRLLLSSEVFESPIVLKGCYEGTMNTAKLRFREDSTFEVHWTGAFFADSWSYGRWTKNKDTIILVNEGKFASFPHDTLVIIDTHDHKFFIPFKNRYSEIVDYHWFYFGECMGYN